VRGPVYLVRHAKARRRESWPDNDRLRPLTKTGRRQAEGLVRLLRSFPVARITSSPYVRCVQTIRPLALDRSIGIVESEGLSEGASLDAMLELLEPASDGADVFCSHGDVIPAVVTSLAGAGMKVRGEEGWKKGSIWVLEREAGAFGKGRYIPPPA
jgi:8-oxo-dGTP diphosphatase